MHGCTKPIPSKFITTKFRDWAEWPFFPPPISPTTVILTNWQHLPAVLDDPSPCIITRPTVPRMSVGITNARSKAISLCGIRPCLCNQSVGLIARMRCVITCQCLILMLTDESCLYQERDCNIKCDELYIVFPVCILKVKFRCDNTPCNLLMLMT